MRIGPAVTAVNAAGERGRIGGDQGPHGHLLGTQRSVDAKHLEGAGVEGGAVTRHREAHLGDVAGSFDKGARRGHDSQFEQGLKGGGRPVERLTAITHLQNHLGAIDRRAELDVGVILTAPRALSGVEPHELKDKASRIAIAVARGHGGTCGSSKHCDARFVGGHAQM
ncbi:unannotated protein [freshwater metagenome]|uniref:Unannotated protein n=1 Tax=freshwater metagenome TaxID=449393 RepID=A0A6J7KGP0_9ZZZZ